MVSETCKIREGRKRHVKLQEMYKICEAYNSAPKRDVLYNRTNQVRVLYPVTTISLVRTTDSVSPRRRLRQPIWWLTGGGLAKRDSVAQFQEIGSAREARARAGPFVSLDAFHCPFTRLGKIKPSDSEGRFDCPTRHVGDEI